MKPNVLEQLSIKIFADGADQRGIAELNAEKYIQGLTTNPTLMRKAGIENYETFAQAVLEDAVGR